MAKKNKEIDIMKEFFPSAYKLKTDKEGNISTIIVDEELDGFECEFIGADSIQINTEGYSYITLSINKLYKLIELIEKAESKYRKQK